MAPAQDLAVIKSTDDGTLYPAVWPDPSSTEDVASLVQKIVISLFTAPGEDEWDPNFGAALVQRLVAFTATDVTAAQAIAVEIVDKVASDLAGDPLLEGLALQEFSFNPTAGAWALVIAVRTPFGVVSVPATTG